MCMLACEKVLFPTPTPNTTTSSQQSHMDFVKWSPVPHLRTLVCRKCQTLLVRHLHLVAQKMVVKVMVGHSASERRA